MQPLAGRGEDEKAGGSSTLGSVNAEAFAALAESQVQPVSSLRRRPQDWFLWPVVFR